MNLERRKGDNDNNKLHAIGYTGADSRRCGLSNSRHDYAPAIDHSLMKRSSDTFAEFLPRSSIIHLSHALDSSIFHRGHPASMHHTVHDYINPVITGRIRESVRTNINLHPNNAPVNRDNDPSISVIYLSFFFFPPRNFLQFFSRTVRLYCFFVRCSIRWNLIFRKLFLETYLRYRIFCKNISSF